MVFRTVKINMFIRPILLSFLLLFVGTILAPAGFCAAIDDWNAIILEGSKHKIDGKYDLAIQSFTKALSFAEKQKLPDKCLPISLCRLAEVELITNNVKEGDSRFDQITNLIKTQKAAGTLDPQVKFWAAALSDAYQSNHKPDTQELCLKHACYLKTLIYGSTHRECTDCLSKLAAYYIEQDKIEKAIKILEFNEALLEKQFGKDPDRFGNNLNDSAIKCEKEHKYAQAKELELAVIKIAQINKSTLNAGLPAFYSFLGMNALAQGKPAESKAYFRKALYECPKAKGPLKNQSAAKYLVPLSDIAWQNNIEGELSLAENQCRSLVAIYKAISPSSDIQYDIFFKMAKILYSEDGKAKTIKHRPEAIKYYELCIEQAKLSNSTYKNDLPGLYTVLGSCQMVLHKFDEANLSFQNALDANVKTNEFQRAWIFYCWGYELGQAGQDHMAIEKLNIAYKQVLALPVEKRGTLFADLLWLRAVAARNHGDKRQAQEFFKQSSTEIQLQKKFKSKLGPDMFHRM